MTKPKRDTPATLKPMQNITPVLRPPLDTTAQFRPMLQGAGTNRLTRISTRKSPPPVDAVTGMATITEGSLTVFIEKYDSLAGGLRISTHKLLDAFTIALTEQNHYRGKTPANTFVTISLDEYMRQCGIPMTKASKDKTRRKVKEDLDALFNTSLEWSEPTGGGKDVRDYAKMRIISYQGIKNGKIQVRFSQEIAEYLTHAYLMQYPVSLFKIDERNPSAYYIGKKLLLHHSMDSNHARGTHNVLSVRALLECAPDIPSYEEVAQKDRHLEQRIIAPFETALNALRDTIHWEYANSGGTPMTPEQLKKFSYAEFINAYVRFEVLNAPDQSARRERKLLRGRRAATGGKKGAEGE